MDFEIMGEGISGTPGRDYDEFLEGQELEIIEEKLEELRDLNDEEVVLVTLYDGMPNDTEFRCVVGVFERNGDYVLNKVWLEDGSVYSNSVFSKESLEGAKRLIEISAKDMSGKIESQN